LQHCLPDVLETHMLQGLQEIRMIRKIREIHMTLMVMVAGTYVLVPNRDAGIEELFLFLFVYRFRTCLDTIIITDQLPGIFCATCKASISTPSSSSFTAIAFF
jgi:hypothetical protein